MRSPHAGNGIYRPPVMKKRLDDLHLRWEENEQGKGNLPKGRRGGINKDDRHLELVDGSDPVPWDASSTKLLEILGLTRAEGMAIWHAFDASVSEVNIDGKHHPDEVVMLNRLGFVTALDTDRDALMNMIFHRYLPHEEKKMNFRAYVFAVFDICSMSVPHFYEMLWEMFDKDRDGVLTPPEVAELFHSLLQGGLGTRANLSVLANKLYEDLASRSSDEGQTITGPVFVSFMKDHDELTMPLFEIQRKLGSSALGNRFWEKTRKRRKQDSDAEENMHLRYLIRENVVTLPARPAFRYIPQENPLVNILRSLVPRKVKPEFDYGAEELDRDAQGEVVGRRMSLHMPLKPPRSTALSRAMSNLTSKFRTSVASGKKAALPPLKGYGTSLVQARRRQERQSRYQVQQRQMSSLAWGSAASTHGQTSPTGAGTVLSSPRAGGGTTPVSPKSGEADRPTTATDLFRTIQSAEYATMPPSLETAEPPKPQSPQSPHLPSAAERRALASSRSMSSKKGLGRLNFSDEKEDMDSKRCLSGRAYMQVSSREFDYKSPRIEKHVRSVTVLKT